MSRIIRPTSRFKKDPRLMKGRGKDLDRLEVVVDSLARDVTFAPENRDHNLKGNWTNHRECHIEPDWLLIYKKVIMN